MPRRKRGEEPVLSGETILMLPPPRPARGNSRHEDLYENPPGAVPQLGPSKPIERKLSPAEHEQRALTRKEQKMMASRHARYLDALIHFAGDRERALAHVFGLSAEEVRPQIFDLLAEVRRGLAHSSLGELLEDQGLGLQGRVNILARHAYSDNPAASLKSIDMINDLAGQSTNEGSFESFIRLAKNQKG